MKGRLIVIVAPSGTGKSTIAKKVLECFPSLSLSISYTTRPKRSEEVYGEDYYFISLEKFNQMKENEEFLEWAKVHGNFYGTSKEFVYRSLEKGKDLFFDLDVQGTDSFVKLFSSKGPIVTIFVAPPSIEELEKRLLGRGTERTGVIDLRLANAKVELKRQGDYDHRVLNKDLIKATEEICRIVKKFLQ